MSKKMTIAELNEIYEKANEVDSPLFSEQRSNALLAAGEHYTKKNSVHWNRVVSNSQLNDEQKLRLTKNHTHRIVHKYVDNIFSMSPGVAILPNNEKEVQDQKTAELNASVWNHWKKCNDYRDQVRRDIEDFVKIGEVGAKIYFEPHAGELLGYEAEVDELGESKTDESGEELPDKGKPVFQGAIKYERIYGFNLLREATSKDSIFEGKVIYRKMVDLKLLKEIYEKDEEKLKFIQSGSGEVYTIFDGQNGSYQNSKDQTMVREYYQPPNYCYPEGYFWITTSIGILEEGPLPFGVFPIIFTGFDDIPTTPRKRSIIKVTRPFQAEINRAASGIATAQICLGDDKLLVMTGSKVTQSSKLPGIRVINYTGMPPQVLPGRSGEQYVSYMQGQIAEMYQAANLDDETADKAVQSPDSVAELLKTAKNKKKYSLYAERMELYQVKKCETVLKLAKAYYDNDMLIPAIGKSEMVNVAEFKNSEPMHYRISLEPSNDDYETKFGKYLTFNTILQYVGNKLEKDDIGKILRVMPYAGNEKIFEDFTVNFDIAQNMILALERGEQPKITPGMEPKYLIQKLSKRMSEADYQALHPFIQQNYDTALQTLKEMEVQNMLAIKKAQEELIPATGPLVKCELYVADPENPGKTAKAKMPTDSLVWLQNQLKSQGIELEQLAKIQDGQVSDMARQFLDNVGNQMQPQGPQNPLMPR